MTRQDHSHATAEWMQAVLASDEDLLARVLELGLQALMEAERDAYVGAEPFERTGKRRTQRNGYKPRTLRTRVGSLELRVPQTRDGRFYPSLLERYQRSEGALITALAECYVQGVSTRKVASICEEMFGEGLSHETVSRYARELDAELEPWRTRLLETSYPYLMLDARYEKARVEHRIVDVAVLVAVGVNADGYRQVLAVDVAHGETKASWSAFLEGLVERGLEGVELVVADRDSPLLPYERAVVVNNGDREIRFVHIDASKVHRGLLGRARRHPPGSPARVIGHPPRGPISLCTTASPHSASYNQRCQRHFLENALERAPTALEDELHERLRAIWDEAEGLEEARAGLRALATDLEPEHAELAEWLEVEGAETLSCFHFPQSHRRRIRTTNGLERVNQELKRRTRVVRIFPDPESCLRLATALLKEYHEDWITGRRYLRMDPLREREPAEDLKPAA